MKYEWYQPAGFLNCNRAIDWLHESHFLSSWPLENHFGAYGVAGLSLRWLLITTEVMCSPPATNETLSKLMSSSPSPPWHQNTGWWIRRRLEALFKTLHSQSLSACSGARLEEVINVFIKIFFILSNCQLQPVPLVHSYQSGVYTWHGKSPWCFSTPWSRYSRCSSQGWGVHCLNTLTDSCGRMSCVRHPFRRVCTHSIYKCHPWPQWPHKAFWDGLLQTYNSH